MHVRNKYSVDCETLWLQIFKINLPTTFLSTWPTTQRILWLGMTQNVDPEELPNKIDDQIN